MKCICSQKDLKEALLAASRALPTNPQTPILGGIYITTAKNMLEVHATDFSTGVISKLPAEIENEGAVVINGKNITEIVSKLSGDIIKISTEDEDNLATFISDGTKFSLYTMEAEEYPKIIAQDLDNKFYIKNKVLKNLILRSTFACADEKDSRPVFQGCSITVKDEEINFVATNTHRLVVVKNFIEDTFQDTANFIVPSNALNNVLWILNAVQDEKGVKVDFSDKQIAFTINQYYITCRLIDGTFPPHDKVIPATCETFAELEINDFRAAVNRVSIISKQTEYNTVRLKFDNNKDDLELAADSYATGKVVEHVRASVEGPSIEIAFNLRYIQEFLKISGGDSDSVRIGMNDNLSPTEFRLPDDDNLIYIVTPVRA